MKRSAVLIAILASSGLAIAQDKLPPRVVRVAGTAEVKVVPDRAVIELGVEPEVTGVGPV